MSVGLSIETLCEGRCVTDSIWGEAQPEAITSRGMVGENQRAVQRQILREILENSVL